MSSFCGKMIAGLASQAPLPRLLPLGKDRAKWHICFYPKSRDFRLRNPQRLFQQCPPTRAEAQTSACSAQMEKLKLREAGLAQCHTAVVSEPGLCAPGPALSPLHMIAEDQAALGM